MTDQEHSARIGELASALNQAIRAAAEAGLQVKLDVPSLSMKGLKFPYQRINPTVTRKK